MERLTTSVPFEVLFYLAALFGLVSVGLFCRLCVQTIKNRQLHNLFPAILLILFITVSFNNVIRLLSIKPHVSSTSPVKNSTVAAYDTPVVITFDAPVDIRKLTLHSAPDTQGAFVANKYLGILPFARTVTYYPKISYTPGEKIMIYAANITPAYSRDFGSEYLLEFNAPPISTSVSANIAKGATDIQPNTKIQFQLASPAGKASYMEAAVIPEEQFRLQYTDGQTATLMFDKQLTQGTTYTVHLKQAPVVYDITSGRTISKGEIKEIETLTFTTVRPPLIRAIYPEGTSVLPNETIRIYFDDTMDKESAENRVSLTPPVNGSYNWDFSGSILTFTPNEALAKSTAYTLTIKSGIKNTSGGAIESDVTHAFTTVGSLLLTKSNPANDSVTIPVTSPLTFTFNQAIDKELIESRVSVSPPFQKKITWEGNIITMTPSIPMKFSTRYTVTFPKGMSGVYGLPSADDMRVSFTTQDEQYLLHIPLIHQEELFTCNIAATRMLLAHKNIFITENDLKSKIGSSGVRGSGNPHKGYVASYGTYWEPIEKVLNSYGKTRLYTSWNITGITAEIVKGNPVMIWSQNGWSDPHDVSWTAGDGTVIKAVNGMHSYIVTGFKGSAANPTHLSVNDPWRGSYELTTAEFLSRWKYFYTGIVLE